jgi:hypothetical protein
MFPKMIPRYAGFMSASEKPFPLLRRMMILLAFAVVAAAIYDGGIFYSRWNERRKAEQANAKSEADHARQAIDSVGGGGLKILNFYAAPGSIRRARLCYGVTGAKNVRLEPPVEEVWPAITRCVQVSPAKDTEYKLIADDGQGHSTAESAVVRIVR